MAEKINDKTVFSLLEVTRSIEKTIRERYKTSFWVKAEMNKLNYYKHSGHCYPELMEKKDGRVIAQVKSVLWKTDYIKANNEFLRVLKEPLKDGIKILFLASVTFDPAHGLALQILGIDPGYTLGDLEHEKQETIRQLHAEGIYNSNRSLRFPRLPQRIAIISVETSKGYADFLKVMETNSWNYKFYFHLFPSLLQGDNAVPSIRAQLQRIRKVRHHFDVVAIIRGGGGDVGLSCYNHYELAREIALFPIPVLTGIGHATNQTVTEMISFSNAITPTKLAEYLLQHFHNFSVPVQNAEKKVIDKARRLITEKQVHFTSEVKLFRSVTENVLMFHNNAMQSVRENLSANSRYIFKNESSLLQSLKTEVARETEDFCDLQKDRLSAFGSLIHKDSVSQVGHHRLRLAHHSEKLVMQAHSLLKNENWGLTSVEKNMQILNPQNVLKRGYSISMLNGNVIRDAGEANNGDVLTTNLYSGNIISIVQQTNKTSDL